jgi:crossover junction endodeoxyribonuclease RuvC
LTYVTSGTIRLSPKNPLHLRLRELHAGLTAVIREFSPSEAAVEKVFFAKSARSALSLGHARGVALLAAASEGLSVYEYSALEVKKAVTGYGRAEKRQVQEMIRAVLGMDGSVCPDGADALALAFCHTNRAWVRMVEHS